MSTIRPIPPALPAGLRRRATPQLNIEWSSHTRRHAAIRRRPVSGRVMVRDVDGSNVLLRDKLTSRINAYVVEFSSVVGRVKLTSEDKRLALFNLVRQFGREVEGLRADARWVFGNGKRELPNDYIHSVCRNSYEVVMEILAMICTGTPGTITIDADWIKVVSVEPEGGPVRELPEPYYVRYCNDEASHKELDKVTDASDEDRSTANLLGVGVPELKELLTRSLAEFSQLCKHHKVPFDVAKEALSEGTPGDD